jgi:hypothetical protein
LSRVLVLLTTLLLLVMPITEHLCNWDNFLRGGPDVEFSLLAWLLFAAMVVLSMHGTMLRPTVMQPEMMEPVSAARAGMQGTGVGCFAFAGSVMSQLTASSRSRQSLNESASALDSGEGFGAPVPKRI